MTGSQKTLAFTLVELLVAISIISVLIALMLPALGQARASGRAIQCLSNQRQLYIPFLSYTQANKDYIPYRSFAEPVGNYRHLGWLGRLTHTGFLETSTARSRGARRCPEVHDAVTILQSDPAWDKDNWGHFPTLMDNCGYRKVDNPVATQWILGPYRLSGFASPVHTAAYFDGQIYSLSTGYGTMDPTSLNFDINMYRWRAGINMASTNQYAAPDLADRRFRHLGNTTNFTFMDGHAERRAYDPSKNNGWGRLFSKYGARAGDL